MQVQCKVQSTEQASNTADSFTKPTKSVNWKWTCIYHVATAKHGYNSPWSVETTADEMNNLLSAKL